MGKFTTAVRDTGTDVVISGGKSVSSAFNSVSNGFSATEEVTARAHSMARDWRRKGEAADALSFQKEVAIAVVTRTREVSEAFRDVQKALKEDKELEEIHNQLFGSFDEVMAKAMSLT
jgi:hypothetical protein